MTLVLSGAAATPVEVARPDDGAWRLILMGLFVSVVMLGGLSTWAAFTIIPQAAITEGVVVVQGSRRPVQNLYGGTVSEVLVSNGDLVKKGQTLIRLETDEVAAETTVLSKSLDAALAVHARLNAEWSEADTVSFPDELTSRLSDPDITKLLDQQRELFAARHQSFTSAEAVLRQQIVGLTGQVTGFQNQIAEVDAQIASTKEEQASMKALLDKGLVEKSKVLALDRQVASLNSERVALEAQIATAQNNVSSTELEVAQLGKKRREDIATSLSEAEAQIADIRPRLKAAQDRVRQGDVVAPLDGYVLNLAVHGAGATLTSSQVALEIVPAGDTLVIQSKIQPRDIEQVKVGQSAELHFTVNKAKFQQIIKGEVISIGADRQTDTQSGQPYYLATVSIDPDDLKAANLQLIPGMGASAAIVTGERSVLQYLLGPILDVASFAMRES